MWDHLKCRCGHYRMLHGKLRDSECRICDRVWIHGGSSLASEVQPCWRFRWRWLAF